VVNGGKSFGNRRHWQPLRAIYKDRVDNGAPVGFPRTAQTLDCRHIRFDQPPLRIGKVACVTPPSSLIFRAVAMAFVITAIAWWVWPVTRSSQSLPVAAGSAGLSTPSASSALQPAAESVIPQRQITLWDVVIAGNVTEAIISIKAGADVNGLDTGTNPNERRPLDWAGIRNDAAMIRALLDAGANINSTNRTGFTPLHHTAVAGSEEAATLLITNGQSHPEKRV